MQIEMMNDSPCQCRQKAANSLWLKVRFAKDIVLLLTFFLIAKMLFPPFMQAIYEGDGSQVIVNGLKWGVFLFAAFFYLGSVIETLSRLIRS